MKRTEYLSIRTINNCKDLQAFRGKIVAYKSDKPSYHFYSPPSRGAFQGINNEYSFAAVSTEENSRDSEHYRKENEDRCASIIPLVSKYKECSKGIKVTSDRIEKFAGSLSMREATDEEIKKIHSNIGDGEAKFCEYYSSKEGKEILNQSYCSNDYYTSRTGEHITDINFMID